MEAVIVCCTTCGIPFDEFTYESQGRWWVEAEMNGVIAAWRINDPQGSDWLSSEYLCPACRETHSVTNHRFFCPSCAIQKVGAR